MVEVFYLSVRLFAELSNPVRWSLFKKAMINDKILLLKNFFSQKTADGKCWDEIYFLECKWAAGLYE